MKGVEVPEGAFEGQYASVDFYHDPDDPEYNEFTKRKSTLITNMAMIAKAKYNTNDARQKEIMD